MTHMTDRQEVSSLSWSDHGEGRVLSLDLLSLLLFSIGFLFSEPGSLYCVSLAVLELYIGNAGLRLTEVHLPLPLEC